MVLLPLPPDPPEELLPQAAAVAAIATAPTVATTRFVLITRVSLSLAAVVRDGEFGQV